MAERMPVLFIGNGTPLNGVADNEYTQALAQVTTRFPRPKAILVTSQRWASEDGVAVTSSPQPRIIRDYDEFPEDVMKLTYPAKGDPELARQVSELTGAKPDKSWGLDRNAWLPLLHMYPEGDIPVVELSYNDQMTYVNDLERGMNLKPLRDEGVLIIVTGNIVRNTAKVNWNDGAQPYDWAVQFDDAVAEALASHSLLSLLLYRKLLPGAALAAPADDYYRSLFVAIGAAGLDAQVESFYRGFELSSVSLSSYLFQ